MNAFFARAATSAGLRWFWPAACVIALAGYFGAWVSHPVAGLVITGLDLGEYAKFLPAVTIGEVVIWRQGFYAPLVAVTAACSLLTYRRFYGYPFLVRLALILMGLVSTLNLLPPAWSPAVLQSPEFRLQTTLIVAGIVMLGLSPLLAMLPAFPAYATVAALSVAATLLPVYSFPRVLPGIAALYTHPIRPGIAMYVSIAGLLFLLASCLLGLRRETSGD